MEGLDGEWLSGDEAREVCDWLSKEVVGACMTSIEPMVDSRLLTRSALMAAEIAGARLLSGEVVGLCEDGGRTSGVELADGSVVEGMLW